MGKLGFQFSHDRNDTMFSSGSSSSSRSIKAMDSKINKKTARSPKCARCRNHGFAVELKGHSGKCQFVSCACWKCSLIAERTRIMARHRRIRRSQPDDGDHPKTAAADGNGDTEREGPESGSRAAGEDAKQIRREKTDTGSSSIPPHTVQWKRSHDGDLFTGQTNDPAHFPWECVLTENALKNTYTGEMLGITLPFQLSSHHPDSYVYPAFMVGLQLPPPGTLREAVGFPYLPHSVQAYLPEPGVPHESLMSYYAPYPPYPWVREECSPKPYYYTQSYKGSDNGAGGPSPQSGHDQGMVQGSQERDLIIPENDLCSNDTA